MTITEAIRKLTDLLGEHGNLQLVDPDGDIVDFTHVVKGFPYPVIVVEFVLDD